MAAIALPLVPVPTRNQYAQNGACSYRPIQVQAQRLPGAQGGLCHRAQAAPGPAERPEQTAGGGRALGHGSHCAEQRQSLGPREPSREQGGLGRIPSE
ncbi:hypothetical protein MGU_06416 [Metarhizium guizhouense ARSEF 977]|uniref:Uncharacterized protein n=1 Tax=Metarhizium guizhouense (strain ARSEF 977) TaxID=1276136 RepID=A0A0B4I2A0_METGA|nr:hypothetical protein MGU_06416 [Metarhizium guizhouense ARSEF 977]